MRFPLWITFLVAVFTLVIGFGIGRFSNASQDISEQRTHASPSSSREQSRPDASRSSLSDEAPRAAPSLSSSVLSHLSLSELEQRARLEASAARGSQNSTLLSLLVSEWAELDPYGVLAFAQEQERTDWLHESLAVLSRNNPDDALLWIEDNITNLSLQRYLAGAVYQGLAQVDPTAAIARIEQGKTGAQRDQLLYATVSEWARQDIESVFDWIEVQEDSPFLFSVYNQVLGSYIEQNPQDAVALISAMEENADKSNFANRAAYHLALQNPQAALSWAETLQGEAKHFALMGLMERWGSTADSLQALDYVKSQPVSGNSNELFSMLMMKFANANPDVLAQQVSSLSENQQRLAVIQLAQVYSSNSPEKTTAWLDTLESGPIRDTALQTALNSFRGSNIDQAFELSETFSNEALRQEEMKKTLLEWMPVDPVGAYAALENTTAIPDSRKENMRQYLDREAPNVADYLLPARAN